MGIKPVVLLLALVIDPLTANTLYYLLFLTYISTCKHFNPKIFFIKQGFR